eukprot:g10425.t1
MSVRAEDERTMAFLRKECDQSVATAMEAKLKEKQAMSLVSGLQADIAALQSQVGVLQSALWLERERANAAVKASRSALCAASKSKTNAGSRSALTLMNPSSPASVAAAEAAAVAAGALATSSTRGRGGGFSSQRRHGFPLKRAAGPSAAGGMAPFGRPSTASASTIAPCAQKSRRRAATAGVGARGLYGEGSSEFWGGGGWNGDDRNTSGELLGFLGAAGNSPTGTALTEPSLGGLHGREAHGAADGFFPAGDDGRRDARQEPTTTGRFVLDLDGRRGHACSGGMLHDEAGGGEVVTPFQKWKNDRGITSPGVAEVFAGRGCGS